MEFQQIASMLVQILKTEWYVHTHAPRAFERTPLPNNAPYVMDNSKMDHRIQTQTSLVIN